jgi:hypothetical protein
MIIVYRKDEIYTLNSKKLLDIYLTNGVSMKRLWQWLKGEYKLWKLRRQDPYIYEDED